MHFMCDGAADRCIELMLDWSSKRNAFGKPISNFGQIQAYIGDSYAMTEAARALVYSEARKVNPKTENRWQILCLYVGCLG